MLVEVSLRVCLSFRQEAFNLKQVTQGLSGPDFSRKSFFSLPAPYDSPRERSGLQ
jgi:hypothetical protein